MKLSQKLSEIRDRSKKNAPKHILDVMETATENLRNKGFQVIGVGEKLPEFKLLTTEGQTFTNKDIDKPTIFTFYRGGW